MAKVKFEDVVTRVNTREDRFNTNLLYYVGGEHIESNELKVQGKGLIKGSTIGPMFYCGFKKGDVLLVSRNPHLRKASIVDFDGICSEKTFVLGSKDCNVLLQEYLAVLVQSNDFWNYCEEHKSGGVNYFVNWSTLANYEFDLPDIAHQSDIAKKVWAAYELKESYRNLLDLSEQIVISQFVDMFKDSPKEELSKHCKIEKGTTITRNQVSPGNVPVVAGGQEPSCYHNVSNRPANMISISASGAYAGFVNFWQVPIFASDCNTVSPIDNTYNPIFLAKGLLAMQKEIYALQKGGAQPHVYGKDIEKLLFPKPNIDEQEKFVKFASKADETKISLQDSINSIDEIIKSLINS